MVPLLLDLVSRPGEWAVIGEVDPADGDLGTWSLRRLVSKINLGKLRGLPAGYRFEAAVRGCSLWARAVASDADDRSNLSRSGHPRDRGMDPASRSRTSAPEAPGQGGTRDRAPFDPVPGLGGGDSRRAGRRQDGT